MEYVVKESLSGNWIKSIVAILIYAVLWNIIPGFFGSLRFDLVHIDDAFSLGLLHFLS